jgi:hypothetical protein
VNVDHPVPREPQQWWRQDFSVRGHNPKIHLPIAQGIDDCRIPNSIGLKERQVASEGNLLHGGVALTLATPARTVWLCDNANQDMLRA